MLEKAIPTYWSILEINVNRSGHICAYFHKSKKSGSQTKGTEQNNKVEIARGQLPKKLILTRKLTILSERKCHFLKFKVKKLITKSSFMLSAHVSGAK